VIKKYCDKKSSKKYVKPGCKAYKGCKLCWDKTGKIVKKWCPKKSTKKPATKKGKTIKPGCKKYQVGGKWCVECWDAYGKPTKKYCK